MWCMVVFKSKWWLPLVVQLSRMVPPLWTGNAPFLACVWGWGGRGKVWYWRYSFLWAPWYIWRSILITSWVGLSVWIITEAPLWVRLWEHVQRGLTGEDATITWTGDLEWINRSKRGSQLSTTMFLPQFLIYQDVSTQPPPAADWS